MRPTLLLALGLVTGCAPDPSKDSGAGDTATATATATDTAVAPVDADGDGADAATDCDDADSTRHPGAAEVCDEVDNDCDGEVDDAATDARTWYADADGDGHGVLAQPIAACRASDGLAALSDDCDDADAFVHPGATEVCDDVDNDCDGTVDAPGLITLDGATNHATIAEALDAAQDGSTVLLCDGTYEESVTIEREVTLASLHGAGAVTLDAGHVGSVVTLAAGAATLSGLVLTHGSGTLVGGKLVGGGIAVTDGLRLTVDDCVIEDNTAERGAGLFTEFGAVTTITGSIVRDNAATGWGGGAMVRGTLFAFSSGFSDNDASHGGAVMVSLDGTVSLHDLVMTGNHADTLGGAMYVMAGATVDADDGVVFSGNTSAGFGGGVALNDAAAWSGGVFQHNVADNSGGGMMIALSPGVRTTVSGVIVADNAATNGAGIFVSSEDATAALTLRDAVLEANVASGVAGGLYAYQGTLTLARVLATINTASTGGGVYLQGGVAFDADALEVSSNVATASAGGLGAEGGTLTLTDASVTDNLAGGVGAGVYLSGADATLGGASSVLRNVATGAGGGAWVTGQGGRLRATGADFGTDAADNAPDDVALGGATLLTQTGFGAGVSFTCDVDAGSCQ